MTETTLADLKELGGGKYPPRSKVTGRPIAYICLDYGCLCAACANGENGSLAADDDLDKDCPDDAQWIVTNFMYCERGSDHEFCHHCGASICD